MPVELRPSWCLTDDAVTEVLVLGDWTTADGHRALALDGDDWRPGETLTLTREIGLNAEPIALRRRLGLMAGQVIGLAARWSCRSTATAGVHLGGPDPIPLIESTTVTLDVPAGIAGSIEVETCLVVNWTIDERPLGACPDGALVWSDGWANLIRDRTILLEGDEARVPVRTVSFADYFGRPSQALWAVDLDTSTAPDDLIANVVTVLLNKDVMSRDFRGQDGEPDAARIPASALAGMSVDLIRSLTSQLGDELDDGDEWSDLADGTVGAMLDLRLTEAFGSVSGALANYEHDQPTFTRELWNRFAPDSWSASR